MHGEHLLKVLESLLEQLLRLILVLLIVKLMWRVAAPHSDIGMHRNWRRRSARKGGRRRNSSSGRRSSRRKRSSCYRLIRLSDIGRLQLVRSRQRQTIQDMIHKCLFPRTFRNRRNSCVPDKLKFVKFTR